MQLFLLLIVVITALAFDFTNGFHDAGNAMAGSIATGALKPKAAVALSASLNLVGAFLSIAVAATIAKGLVDAHLVTLELVFAGLVGGIVWNLLTWLLGLPSSSSHALIGGIVGAMIAAVGGHGVIWHGLVSKVILPALLAPTIALIVATERRLVQRLRPALAGRTVLVATQRLSTVEIADRAVVLPRRADRRVGHSGRAVGRRRTSSRRSSETR